MGQEFEGLICLMQIYLPFSLSEISHIDRETVKQINELNNDTKVSLTKCQSHVRTKNEKRFSRILVMCDKLFLLFRKYTLLGRSIPKYL